MRKLSVAELEEWCKRTCGKSLDLEVHECSLAAQRLHATGLAAVRTLFVAIVLQPRCEL
jgi:hypothetical protein